MKPYLYIDRYVPGPIGSLGNAGGPAIKRRIPTALGSYVRVAFHGIGDAKRSLELWVQPNGHWSVETGPGPVTSGERTTIVHGRLPIDGEPETHESDETRALDRIAEILSGQEWSADTAPAIAEIVRATGRTVADVDDLPTDEELVQFALMQGATREYVADADTDRLMADYGDAFAEQAR